MFIINFRKVTELFPMRKVRTVRTEQLWIKLWTAAVGSNQTFEYWYL